MASPSSGANEHAAWGPVQDAEWIHKSVSHRVSSAKWPAGFQVAEQERCCKSHRYCDGEERNQHASIARASIGLLHASCMGRIHMPLQPRLVVCMLDVGRVATCRICLGVHALLYPLLLQCTWFGAAKASQQLFWYCTSRFEPSPRGSQSTEQPCTLEVD